jgi:hypothetical protein
MWRAQEVFEIPGGLYVLDSDWHNNQPLAHCPFYLTTDLRRSVRVRRKHEQHHARAVDRLQQCRAPFHPGTDIARRDPASNAARLQLRANRVSDRLVARRMAYENVVRHVS